MAKSIARTPILFGLLARFENQEDLLRAVEQAYQAGYRKFDAYTPYPVAELSQTMGLKPSPLPLFMLAGGVSGAIGGIAMQAFAMGIDYPLNIGGKPLISWQGYIPIAFELTILLAALGGIAGLFIFTRLPQPYHPVFNLEDFNQHGSQDGFYLGIECSDPLYDPDKTLKFIEGLHPVQVAEVEA